MRGRRLDKALTDCQCGGSGPGFDFQFGEDAGDVIGDGFRAHEELRRDVAIGFPVYQQTEHLRFASRQLLDELE